MVISNYRGINILRACKVLLTSVKVLNRYIVIFLSDFMYNKIYIHLSVNLNHSFAMAWIDFVSAVRAKSDPEMINQKLTPLHIHTFVTYNFQ